MNIELKKKTLYFNNYKLRCAIGKRGITVNKKEGDKKTPKGIYSLGAIFYRKDRISNLKSPLKKKEIKKNMGWCDDPSSKFYNKLIKFPFDGSAEKLWLKKNIYDVIVIINYNLNPTIRYKGSAIFLHIAKKNYTSTEGCITIKKKDMLFLITKISKKTKLVIR
tara:strand:+ start:4179 stop:4670 length:492 start_codon:yes stop_codon:yes gene_type:complete